MAESAATDERCSAFLLLQTGNFVAHCSRPAGHDNLHTAQPELDDNEGRKVGTHIEWENRT
jgi:hypothetical protein